MQRAIHWFRRDLRVTDNTALARAVAAAEEVVPVYIASDWWGGHRWTGSPRQTFLCGSLASLAGNLEALGGRLVVRRGEAVGELLRLVHETGAQAVFTNADPDPHGRAVESRLAVELAAARVEWHVCQDVVIHGKDEVLTAAGGPFRVFTPYARAWTKAPKPPLSPKPGRLRTPADVSSLPLPQPGDWGLAGFQGGLEPGERAARARLRSFLAAPVAEYAARRDLPGVEGTSRLSQDLRFGLLSPREVHRRCREAAEGLDAAGRDSVWKYVAELIWREFYLQLLGHFPEVLGQEFNPKFRGLPWRHDEEALRRWQEGTTGFPIVDAAMRQLRETGFMHNRARMITAMFLTKDLHLDWRLGEQWFMQCLLDGEIGSNNGGWQWSAGTGADAAPYFRIQNPWSQTKRYDPEGTYIRRWVPELREVSAAALAAPPVGGGSLAAGYPPPMLDHARERDVTLDMFKAVG